MNTGTSVIDVTVEAGLAAWPYGYLIVGAGLVMWVIESACVAVDQQPEGEILDEHHVRGQAGTAKVIRCARSPETWRDPR